MNPNDRKRIDEAETDTAAAVAAGAALADRHVLFTTDTTGCPCAIVPDGLKVVDLSDRLPAPRRLQQKLIAYTPKSFVDYVNEFGDKGTTMIFAAPEFNTITALLDYHRSATEPSWLGHSIQLRLKPTKEWSEWVAHSGSQNAMSQVPFAHFLEDHIKDIAEPNGAELLEIALTIEATKGISFKSHRRLSDGSVLAMYTEDVKGTAQDGKMQIPTEFVLGLVPYEGVQKYRVNARFRYRISDGALVVWYELERPDDVLKDAFTKIVEAIATGTADHARGVLAGALA